MSQVNSIKKSRTFQHLNPFQRGKIEALLEQKVPKAQIAKIVGISRSTLYLEIECGTVEQMRSNLTIYQKYYAYVAQKVYEKNRENCHNHLKMEKVAEFIDYVEQKILKEKRSPDSVCGKAKLLNLFEEMICTKTLYNYIER